VALSIEQRLQRLEVRLGELGHWRVRAAAPLDSWRFDGDPLSVGQPWPNVDGLHEISHPEIEVPDSWPVEETLLELDVGGESLLRIEYGGDSYELFGVDVNHSRFPLRERRCSLGVEAVARFPFGTPNRDPRLSVARLV
jgi:alpha-mannosidase